MKTLTHLKNLLVSEFGNEFKTQIELIVDRTVSYVEEWNPVAESTPEKDVNLLFLDESKSLFLGRNTDNGLLTSFAHKNKITHYRSLNIKRQ